MENTKRQYEEFEDAGQTTQWPKEKWQKDKQETTVSRISTVNVDIHDIKKLLPLNCSLGENKVSRWRVLQIIYYSYESQKTYEKKVHDKNIVIAYKCSFDSERM